MILEIKYSEKIPLPNINDLFQQVVTKKNDLLQKRKKIKRAFILLI